jgi:hypothetical protein
MRTRSGSFITAWNPFSKESSLKANERWNRELKRYLSAKEKGAEEQEIGLPKSSLAPFSGPSNTS